MKYFLYTLIFICLTTITTIHTTPWTIFIYMDSTDSLSDMAIKNITDLLTTPCSDDIHIMLQLHAYNHTALRYTITNGVLSLVEQHSLTDNEPYNLTEGLRWGFKNTQATDHTLFILWDHGYGILNPEWNAITNEWETHHSYDSCNLKNFSHAQHHNHHKGFIFNADRRYLTCNEIAACCTTFQNELFNNKKFDIIAFDTCMGGMLEIAYELKDIATYLIGNQTCALRDGFNYQELCKTFTHEQTPKDVAVSLVHSFDSYYSDHDTNGIYAHSALYLPACSHVTEALNILVQELITTNVPQELLVQARKETPHLCIFSMYTDLIAFVKALEPHLSEKLQHLCHNFYNATTQFIAAQCHGTNMPHAHGFSIYLPTTTIDPSYYTSSCAQQTAWIQLLNYICSPE